ncbi:MAG: hypothetical protein ACLVDF_09690 [Acutalibacteraceae bacterium]
MKAYVPISTTLSGTVSFFKPLPFNTYEPILVTDGGIITVSIFFCSKKAKSEISTTFLPLISEGIINSLRLSLHPVTATVLLFKTAYSSQDPSSSAETDTIVGTTSSRDSNITALLNNIFLFIPAPLISNY